MGLSKQPLGTTNEALHVVKLLEVRPVIKKHLVILNLVQPPFFLLFVHYFIFRRFECNVNVNVEANFAQEIINRHREKVAYSHPKLDRATITIKLLLHAHTQHSFARQ